MKIEFDKEERNLFIVERFADRSFRDIFTIRTDEAFKLHRRYSSNFKTAEIKDA